MEYCRDNNVEAVKNIKAQMCHRQETTYCARKVRFVIRAYSFCELFYYLR